MYDELVTEIGAKANATDLTTHTNNTDIHVTTIDKAKWDKVIDKLDTVDFNTHKNNTDIHITSAERTKLDKVDEKVDKTSITTTIDSASTDTQVPSAKAVFNSISSIGGVDNLTSLVAITNLNDFKGLSFMIGRGTPRTTSHAPDGIDEAFVVEFFPYDTGDRYGVQRLTLVQSADNNYYTFERSLSNNAWRSWKRVCTTSVADVPTTYFDIVSNTNYEKVNSGDNYYEVKNGICYVSVYIKCITPSDSSWIIVNDSLPKAQRNEYKPLPAYDNANNIASCLVETSGKIGLRRGTAGGSYLGTFSYPVAE